MYAQDWRNVLTMLSMMILADGKIYQEEVEAFKVAAVDLKNTLDPKLMMTTQMAKDWFELHYKDIREKYEQPDSHKTVQSLIDGLSGVEDKPKLLFFMLKIAMADGDRHFSENQILTTASSTWGIELKMYG